MEIKTDELIIFRLPQDEHYKSFMYNTFDIAHYFFFDERQPAFHIVKELSKKVNYEYYLNFRVKCMKIEETEITFTIKEFLYLATIVDFVAKCFIGSPKDHLEKIMTSDIENEGFDFKEFRKMYWTKSTNLFQDFREGCKNEKLLKLFNDQLNYEFKF